MELALQYMWEYRMWHTASPTLCDGRQIKILSPGCLNRNEGPDFSNSRIKIDNTVWIGNVEVHIKASDWYRHGHQHNPAYDNIILHVVAVDDARICRKDGSEIPQLVMPLTERYMNMYAQLSRQDTIGIRCANKISELPTLSIMDCIDSLGTQRLLHKAERIIYTLQRHHGNWQQACFVTICRALGFGVNAEPFEMLANRLPLSILHHHSDNLHQLEAIIFGTAGMLNPRLHTTDPYYRFLCNEFTFLSRKYGLSPMPSHLWKNSRMRPGSSPCRRLAIASAMLKDGFSMAADIIDAKDDINHLRSLFNIQMQGYWTDHYNFEKSSQTSIEAMSQPTLDLMLINVAAPFIYANGLHRDEPTYLNAALDILHSLKPENNSIVSAWRTLGVKAYNAFESQALIQLKREYCEKHRCLQCRWGNKLLRNTDGK